MWRYREMLPIAEDEEPVSLGEGATPLIPLANGAFVKDEAQNPTGSFKSRGMSVAVTVAKRLGVPSLVAPSAGNAGGALAAYGARAGLHVRVYVPRDTPGLLAEEMRSYGADVVLVDGLIDDAGRIAAEYARESGAFNVATFREPYRVEGKKTMGYELVEQLGGVPGTIVYPTGGGTGLVAMWKAFEELEQLGWIGANAPRHGGRSSRGLRANRTCLRSRRRVRRTSRGRIHEDVGLARSRRNRRSPKLARAARIPRTCYCRLRC